jgi:hypothetical protein
MNTSHSPAPFGATAAASSDFGVIRYIYDNNAVAVAAVFADKDTPQKTALANAALFVAAPDLLTAATELMDILREMPKGPQHDAMIKLHNAIAKATP